MAGAGAGRGERCRGERCTEGLEIFPAGSQEEVVSVTCALGLLESSGPWASAAGSVLAWLCWGAHLAPPHCTLVSVLVSLAGLTQSCSEARSSPGSQVEVCTINHAQSP